MSQCEIREKQEKIQTYINLVYEDQPFKQDIQLQLINACLHLLTSQMCYSVSFSLPDGAPHTVAQINTVRKKNGQPALSTQEQFDDLAFKYKQLQILNLPGVPRLAVNSAIDFLSCHLLIQGYIPVTTTALPSEQFEQELLRQMVCDLYEEHQDLNNDLLVRHMQGQGNDQGHDRESGFELWCIQIIKDHLRAEMIEYGKKLQAQDELHRLFDRLESPKYKEAAYFVLDTQ